MAYVTGHTNSADFPTTPGSFDTTYNSDADYQDVFVTKLNTVGSALVYSTFLGGRITDSGEAIALARSGRAHVTGQTYSSGFPTTEDAFDRSLSYYDAFMSELSADGSALVYSTYLGGAGGEDGRGIAADRAGATYVTGVTNGDFPTTPGALDRTRNGFSDAFVTKFGS
jgi:hypothetical protein